jgi:hypothetical protein
MRGGKLGKSEKSWCVLGCNKATSHSPGFNEGLEPFLGNSFPLQSLPPSSDHIKGGIVSVKSGFRARLFLFEKGLIIPETFNFS